MSYTPKTLKRQTSDHDGKPCIHFSDENRQVVQVHQREDAPGVYIAAACMTPFGTVTQIAVNLTQSQVHELMTYLRENV